MYKHLFLLIFIAGCGLSTPKIPGFEEQTWAADKYGCEGNRASQIGVLYEYKDMLLGFNQNEIKYFMGKPDEQELYNRSQVFFHYYVKGHNRCEDTLEEPIVLQIRFNALNSSNEVFFRNYK